MSRRTTAIAAALSVLALGSPLVIANANPLATQYFNICELGSAFLAGDTGLFG